MASTRSSPGRARALRRRLPVPAPRRQPARSARRSRAAGTPVVDLGSDFRLDPDWAYGLTELFRQDVLDSRQIANPGCYATAATLALAPLAEAGLLDAPVAIDGKSGVSGAGREPTERTHVSEVEGGVQPYTPTGHRHIAEIERSLARLAGEPVPGHVHAAPRAPLPRPRGDVLRAACAGRSRRPTPRRSSTRATTPSRSSPSSSACTPAASTAPTAATSASGSTSARRRPSARPRSTTSSRARPGRRSRTPTSCSVSTRARGSTAHGLGV